MKLLILDRDGVINYDSPDYIKSPSEWRAIPGSLAAIARANRAGYRVSIASNQSGVGRGLFSKADLDAIHDKMQQQLAAVDGVIDSIFYCPHRPDAGCDCRKPKPGLLQQIAKHYDCHLQDVVMIGDSPRDVQAAMAAGATPFLVETGYQVGVLDAENSLKGILRFADLDAAVTALLQTEEQQCLT